MMKVSQVAADTISVGGRDVSFGQKIVDVVVLSDRVIVNLCVDDFPKDRKFDGRNIVCLGSDGAVLWVIEDSGARIKGKFGSDMPQGYFNLWRTADTGDLRVDNIDWTYDLDPKTGRVSNPRSLRSL